MKKIKLLALLGTASVASTAALAQVPFTFTTSMPHVIIEGDTTGAAVSGTVSGLSTSTPWYVQSVSLDLVGSPTGRNGDIYLKLIHGSENAILVDRPGWGTSFGTAGADGYVDNGFTFTLVRDGFAGAPSTDVHSYQTGAYTADSNGKVYGTFLVDGRDYPTMVTGTETRDKLLSSFDGMDMNGTWQLFAVDYGNGQQLQINSWGITFTNVPEPSQYAMLAGLGLIGFAAYRRYSFKAA